MPTNRRLVITILVVFAVTVGCDSYEFADIDEDGIDELIYSPEEVMNEEAFELTEDGTGRNRFGFENKWVNTDGDEILEDAWTKADVHAEAYTYFFNAMKFYETEEGQPSCSEFTKNYLAARNRRFQEEDVDAIRNICEERRRHMKLQLRLRKYAGTYFKTKEDEATGCIDFVDDFLSEYDEFEELEDLVWRFCVDLKKDGFKELRKLRKKFSDAQKTVRGRETAFKLERKARKHGLWSEEMKAFTEESVGKSRPAPKSRVQDLSEDDYLL